MLAASQTDGRAMRLKFLGATGTVTGSRYLLEHDGARVLVDCGLFQGYKPLRNRNWAAPPFDPAALDAIEAELGLAHPWIRRAVEKPGAPAGLRMLLTTFDE